MSEVAGETYKIKRSEVSLSWLLQQADLVCLRRQRGHGISKEKGGNHGMKNVVERGSLDPVMAVDGYKSGNLDGQAATHVTRVFHGEDIRVPSTSDDP